MGQKFLEKLASLPLLRQSAIRFLKSTARDITISNPYSKKRITINSYNHKGYWYFRGFREDATIKSLKKIIQKDGVVIEIGGHIGFITHLYSKLVGKKGKVFVFEPGVNNLIYTRKNLSSLDNVELIEKACGETEGTVTFYLDRLSGQNNSLLSDYERVETVAKSHSENATRNEVAVQVIKAEDFVSLRNLTVSHMKIDVEGAELQALKGLTKYLGKIPSLMVEVTRDEDQVRQMMSEFGYIAHDVNLNALSATSKLQGNIFFLLAS